MSSTANPHVGVAFNRPRWLTQRGLTIVSMLLLVVGSAFIAGFRQQEWEYPITRALNAYAHRSVLLDRTMHALTARDLLQGVPFVGLIWFLWFAGEDSAIRGRLLVGTVAASLAGVVSRVMQLLLPTHLRPLHQSQLDFVLPFGVEPDALNHFNSFPSDHGAVFFALAAVIWSARPRLGIAAFIWAAVIDLARVYEGYHFPSDLTGSIGLGISVLCLCQPALPWPPVARVVAFAQTRRSWFWMR